MQRNRVHGPGERSVFDRFAGWAAEFGSHAACFIACLLLVVLWLPSFFLFRSVDTWQLIINTVTTIITFLLVALLQNAQRRGELAVHQKLDAIADGLADLMERHDEGGDFRKDVVDLRRAVGVEGDR